MKQLKISLADDLRRHLEAVSAAAGHSLAEEIRRRLERNLSKTGRTQRRRSFWPQLLHSQIMLSARRDTLGTGTPDLTKRFAGPLADA